MAYFGTQEITGGALDYSYTNYVFGTQFALSEQGTIQSISLYCVRALGGNVVLGIYDTSGNLKCQTAAAAVPTADWAWLTRDTTTNPTLEAGNYIIVLASSDDNMMFYVTDGAAVQYGSITYPTLPASGLSLSQYTASKQISAYATYTPGGGATNVVCMLFDS